MKINKKTVLITIGVIVAIGAFVGLFALGIWAINAFKVNGSTDNSSTAVTLAGPTVMVNGRAMDKKCTTSYDSILDHTYTLCMNYWQTATNAALGDEQLILFNTPDAAESLMFYRQAYESGMSDFVAYLKSGSGLDQISNLTQTTINGQSGYTFEFVPDTGYKGMGFSFATKDHMWGIALIAEDAAYDQNKASYAIALQTFTLKQ